MINFILNLISKITKKINNHSKLKFVRLLNSIVIKLNVKKILVNVILKLGGTPIVTAKMRDNTNIIIDLRSGTEFGAFFSGKYDYELIQTLTSLLNPDHYFLDIGANIGFYSISIGNKVKKLGKGKVIAFEPLNSNFNRLKDNLNLNNLNDFCSAYEIGLSNKKNDSLITLREDFLSGSNTGNASITIDEKIDSKFNKVKIRLEKLDDFWENNYKDSNRIGIIKMDIEGHEDLCLSGGQNVIRNHRPIILMEVNKPYYEARGVKMDEVFFKLIPEKYSLYYFEKKAWKRIYTFEKCAKIDNVFIIPNEHTNFNKLIYAFET